MQTTLSPPRVPTFAGARLSTAFQPVVSLATGEVLASEALLRAEWAGEDVAPLEVLAWAKDQGKLADLDLRALEGALTAAGAAGGGVLLVNLEPSTLVDHTAEVLATLERRPAGLYVVVEITERALAADPAGLLRAAEALRTKGHPIAFNDVGASPTSLALLEVVRPGIVKLDVSQLGADSDATAVRVANAVATYAEAVGAAIVATGVESKADVMRARSLGATLGQGDLWGAPGDEWPSQSEGSPLRYAPPPLRAPSRHADTPFGIVSAHRPTQAIGADDLVALVAAVEGCATWSATPAALLAAVGDGASLSTQRRECLANLARDLPLVGILATSASDMRIPGAHTAEIDAADPLGREWDVVTLGVTTAVAIVAREERAADGSVGYLFATTRDRATVVAAAASLLRRLGR